MTSQWQDAAAIAQVAATVLVGVGVVIAMWSTRATVQELRAERIHNVRPKVRFKRGPQPIPCEEAPITAIPGIDWNHAQRVIEAVSERGATGLRIRQTEDGHLFAPWGGIANRGTGTAIGVEVVLEILAAEKAEETFRIDDEKRLESPSPYHPSLNTLHCDPSDLAPDAGGLFYGIPAPFILDHTRQLTGLSGVAHINYTDVYGNAYETAQRFRAWLQHDSSGLPLIYISWFEEVPPVPPTRLRQRIGGALIGLLRRSPKSE